MADHRHVLKATDSALKAFLVGEGVLETSRIKRLKEVTELDFPFIVISSDSAERLRAFNWRVTGAITLFTSSANEGDIGSAADALEYSDDLEFDLLNAIEQYVPQSDYPQTVAATIHAAATTGANAPLDATQFRISSFRIVKVASEIDDDGAWLFAIDFEAFVIA